VSTYQLFLKVQERVKAEAKRLNLDQNPQYSPMQFAGHESGEFLFVAQKDQTSGNMELDSAPGMPSTTKVALQQ
jgi:hypothetical protein